MSGNYLDVTRHDRDAAGLAYVYPVVSRRAGGLSVGINLSPNNACNWHCVYCQVPELTRGSAPPVDLALLKRELSGFLRQVVEGDFMERQLPPECRRLCDVAISGNGEPTSCLNFDEIVGLVITVMRRFSLSSDVKLRLITNGSYLHKPAVRQGLKRMAEASGEVWVKVDSATEEGIRRINGVAASPELLFEQVKIAASLCPTWIQTCMFAWDGEEPSADEVNAYLGFIRRLQAEMVPVHGVLLYGLARESMQPEASHLALVSQKWMEQLAYEIDQAGVPVRFSI